MNGASELARRLLPLWTVGVLGILVLSFAIVAPNFISKASWIALSLTASTVVVLGLGELFVIITGGVDVSVGANVNLSGMVGGLVMTALTPTSADVRVIILLGFGATLLSGVVIGATNGLVITRLRVTPLIATLAMLGVADGFANLLNSAQDFQVPTELGDFGNATILNGWFPMPVVIMAIAIGLTAILLHKLRFGRWTYAVGSSATAARRSGIKVERQLLYVYVLCGLLAALSGFLQVARLSVATPNAGTGQELTAITIVVIGGGSLSGGRGGVSGVVIGSAIVAVLQVGLIVAQVPAFWQPIALGIILVCAVWADQQRVRIRNARPDVVATSPKPRGS